MYPTDSRQGGERHSWGVSLDQSYGNALGWILSSRLKIPDPQLDTVMGAKEASNTQMHPPSDSPHSIYTYLSSEGRGD